MTDPVPEALALWGLAGADCRFIAGRENRVYRVRAAEGDFALRLKRPFYRGEAELLSELRWLEAMAAAGLSAPLPRPSRAGALVERVGGRFADLLGWLPGEPLGRSGEPLRREGAPAIFRAFGETVAKLHEACDRWTPPAGFVRCDWGAEGLLGERPLWGRFWESPALDEETRRLFAAFRQEARRALDAEPFDFGLIHADLVRENVLIDGPSIRLIDFDDGGFGWRLFDIAGALLKNRDEPDYPALEKAFLEGYARLRPADFRRLGLFTALRAATYVGWIVPRMGEAGADAHSLRFVAEARRLCAGWLAGEG